MSVRQNDHPILSALDQARKGGPDLRGLNPLEKVGYDDDEDNVVPATGGEPWHPQASWSELQKKRDPNHMEVTEEAVKCYKLDQEQDIVNDRLYINGEGRPVKTQMEKMQEEVAALKDKSIPGLALQDVEFMISSVVGTIAGLALVGIILFYILNFLYVNGIEGAYKETTTLYGKFMTFMYNWICRKPSAS